MTGRHNDNAREAFGPRGEWLRLRPLDTLFFRGAERFDAGAGGGAYLASLFPPHPGTLFAACNRALLSAQPQPAAADRDDDHEDGRRAATAHHASRGPWLLHEKLGVLVPAPQSLLQGSDGKLHRLAPSPRVLATDLGPVRLPQAWPAAGARLKPLEKSWLTLAGYQVWLDGGIPPAGQLLPSTELWSTERRTGLERDGTTRTAKAGMLYSAEHVRLRKEVELLVNLPAAGPADLACMPGCLTLGGESRAVWVERHVPAREPRLRAPAVQAHGGKLRYTLSLLTPGLGAKWGVAPGGTVHDGVPGRIVCCALGRTLRAGGFDTALGMPERVRSARAAGSVWWLEADADDADTIARLHDTCIGAGAAQGYGHLAVGAWPPGLPEPQ